MGMRLLTPGSPPERYLVHLPFSLSPTGTLGGAPDFGEEQGLSLRFGAHVAVLRASGSGYVLEIPDIPTYQAAHDLLLRLCVALLVFTLKQRVGVRFSHQPVPTRCASYYMPGVWHPAVKAGWRKDNDAFPVDGEISTYETAIVPAHKQVVEREVLGFYPTRVVNPATLEEAYESIAGEDVDAHAVFTNDKLLAAFHLFSTAYHHHVPTSSFVVLVTALEVLSERKPRPDMIRGVVKRLKDEVGRTLQNAADPEARRHLQDLQRELGNFDTQSIQAAICDLLDQHRNDLPGEVVQNESVHGIVREFYAIRSELVHAGRVTAGKSRSADERFWASYRILERSVIALLHAMIRRPCVGDTQR